MKQLRIIGYFMRLIRWPNLMILVITMFLMRYSIIRPLLLAKSYELDPYLQLKIQFPFVDFIILVVSTGLITAAGYIINDYFDRKTDLINKPYKVIVGRFIKRRIAMVMHAVFNIIGVIGGVYISFKNNLEFLSLIFVITTGILWFYSTNYKKQLFIGNFIVSLLTAFIPLLVLLFELPLLNMKYKDVLIINNINFSFICYWIISFSYFAFMTTLSREIIKDTEDLEGDQAYGCISIPMALGIKWTKSILFLLFIIIIGSIIFALYTFVGDNISIIYLSIFILTPLMYNAFIIYKADKKKYYSLASSIMKLVMLFGVLYALIVNYIISINFL